MKRYKRINLEDRIKIKEFLIRKKSFSAIAIILGRDKSSISREVTPWGIDHYCPLKADHYAHKGASLRKKGKMKLVTNDDLQKYVLEKLKLRWSPEQISLRMKKEFPDSPDMRVSHETIYQYVYLHAKKTLRETLTRQLRKKKKKRGKPRCQGATTRGKIPGAVSIDERPEEVTGREIPGHWEGDLIIGKGHKSAIGTLAERTTRAVIIVPLKSYDATTVRKEFEKEFARIPAQMKKSMTYDNGKEMSEHALFTQNTNVKVYFAHPYSPWERPTNENTNGLIRDYFPKGTDFNTISNKRLKEVQEQLNERPRKVLSWNTPKEVFDELKMQNR